METMLAQAVRGLAQVAVQIADAQMTHPLPEHADQGLWQAYQDDARDRLYRVYQQLCELATQIEVTRAQQGPSMTVAQRILAQHHVAYHDLHGILAGVDEAEFDREPAPGEWPLRNVLIHMKSVERRFLARIVYAVEGQRTGDGRPLKMGEDIVGDYVGDDDPAGTLHDVMERFDAVHARVQHDLHSLDDHDLDAPSVMWEGYPLPVGFRMQRCDTHLREHTVQVDKTLVGINHIPNEGERLVRLIYGALGEVEGALLGADGTNGEQQRALVDTIVLITDDLKTLTET